MEVALGRVAEKLAAEFWDLPPTSVVRVVTDCVAEFPYDEAHFIEQAARARLSAERTPTAAAGSVSHAGVFGTRRSE